MPTLGDAKTRRSKVVGSGGNGRTNSRLAKHVLPGIDSRLRRMYGSVPPGSAPLGNKRNPLDELIYIQLSVRTRERTYQASYSALRQLTGGVWERLLRVPIELVGRVLASGGMGSVKAVRLRAQLSRIRESFGTVSLATLRQMSDEDAEAFLRSLPGVGPKVSRCILLYSLDRRVFPVDSNCRRTLRRVGLVPSHIDRKAAHDFLQRLVPADLRRSLHVNLVHLGREICVPVTPNCAVCPIVGLCATGRGRLSRGRSRPAQQITHHPSIR